MCVWIKNDFVLGTKGNGTKEFLDWTHMQTSYAEGVRGAVELERGMIHGAMRMSLRHHPTQHLDVSISYACDG